MYCPDNLDMFNLYTDHLEQKLEKCLDCAECGNKIQTDEFYEFDGDFICPDCLLEHRRWVDDIE